MKNCPHTGKEPSPKGFGRCARNEMIGTIAQGTDSNFWVVVPDKNGRGYWSKISMVPSKVISKKKIPKKKACPQGKSRNPKTGRCKKNN